MEDYTELVIHIIKSIPKGKVMTYGQISRLAGSPRGARQVVRILHSMSNKYNLPWHRVINSKGEIGFKDDEFYELQKINLQNEGIKIIDGKYINLSKYLYNPE